jgi:hypothetical protein
MHSLVRQHLERAQLRTKRQADKGKSERSFAVGDMVYLKLQPYIQSSMARRTNHKLFFKFFRPFRVLARVGKVAYHLELPNSSSVHPVFHVSQLKRSSGSQVVTSALPSDLTGFQVPQNFCSAAGRLESASLSRCLSSGLICLLPSPRGRPWSISDNNFLTPWHGGTPVLKKGEMSATRLFLRHLRSAIRRSQQEVC